MRCFVWNFNWNAAGEARGSFKSGMECIKTKRPRAHWLRSARDLTADFLPPPFLLQPPPSVSFNAVACGLSGAGSRPPRAPALLEPRPSAPHLRAPAAANSRTSPYSRARRAGVSPGSKRPPARAQMAHSTAAVPVGALEQGCPIRVEHDRRRRQFTVRLNGNAVTGPTPAFCLPATGARRGRPLAGARAPLARSPGGVPQACAARCPRMATVRPSTPGAGRGLSSPARWGRGRLTGRGGAGPRGTSWEGGQQDPGEGGGRSGEALAPCRQLPISSTGDPHLLSPGCFLVLDTR